MSKTKSNNKENKQSRALMTIMAPAAPHRSLGADAYRLYTEAYAVYLRTLTNLNVSKEKVSLAKTTCSLDKARLSAKARNDKSRTAQKSVKAPKPATAPAVTMPVKAKSQPGNEQSTSDLKRELLRAQIAALRKPVTEQAVPTPAASSTKTTTTVNNAGPSVNVMGDQNNLYNFSASGVEPARGPSLALMQALPQLRLGAAMGQEMAATSRSGFCGISFGAAGRPQKICGKVKGHKGYHSVGS